MSQVENKLVSGVNKGALTQSLTLILKSAMSEINPRSNEEDEESKQKLDHIETELE